MRVYSGSARIIKLVSETQVKVDVLVDTVKSAPTQPGDWTLEGILWTDERGWPAAGTFYADRLYLAGSTVAPDTIAASRAGDYFSWDEDEVLDDDAVIYAANSDEMNTITNLVSGAHLLVFTDGGEFATLDYPVTPSNVSAIPQGNNGGASLHPVIVEDGILFVTAQRGDERQTLMEMVYSEAAQKYTAGDVALMAATVMRRPVDLALRKGTVQARAYHVFLPNDDDGSMAVLNTLRSQNVTGWCLWETQGHFLRACVAGSTLWVIVRRTLNGATVYGLERAQDGLRVDCGRVVALDTAALVVGGFDHLAGQVVRVYGDGFRCPDCLVSASGEITLESPAQEVEAGLGFDWEIVPMPFAADLPDGTMADSIKRVVSVSVAVKDCESLSIDGRGIPLRALGDDLLDRPLKPFTGIKKVRRLGYDRRGDVVVSGQGPAQVLGVVREVSL